MHLGVDDEEIRLDPVQHVRDLGRVDHRRAQPTCGRQGAYGADIGAACSEERLGPGAVVQPDPLEAGLADLVADLAEADERHAMAPGSEPTSEGNAAVEAPPQPVHRSNDLGHVGYRTAA